MTQNTFLKSGVDIAVIICRAHVARSVTQTWRRIGSFADAGQFLSVSSRLIAGDGGIGSVRLVGDAILEFMVGESDASYTYAQMQGPMAPHLYHGCVALSAIDEWSCTLLYTINYDQTRMSVDDRKAQHVRIRERFQSAVNAMKRVAEE